ncbi:integral membrane protein-like protein [Bimuria novae-zelandiae CBS 107.79]|uniref:Integral membrane protein-like protein n=1 Tax=Bimuria novae-zelandiae CBS 107.79 TaxID=1447943 RepID=A0A6A5VLM4_9PLEO|nr:integral membrane protein-like protein [Bimuria novae-zelandiae CBS 107.79]
MASLEAQEAAVKERIVNHMNKDHGDSVRRYLEAFKQKSFYQVRDARLTDVTLDDMKFNCGGQQVIIPFDPPMKGLKEARERLVQLDKDALKALGRSNITITKYIPPWTPGFHFIHLLNFTPGSYLHDGLLFQFPRFSEFCLSIQPILLSLMFAIHVIEAAIMVKKLSRHGLTPFDGVWWAWVGSAFNEGWTSFQRANALIDEKRAEKDAKKH